VRRFDAGCRLRLGRQAPAKPRGEAAGDPLEKMLEEIQNPQARMKRERQTPLHIAAEDGKTNEVKRLLNDIAVVDAFDRWNRTPLHLAAEWGHVGIIQELLASGANANATTKLGETPLFFALRYWQGDENEATGKAHWTVLVNTLLAAGAKFDLTNSSGLTPLQLAASARNGNPEIVRLFVKSVANVNAVEEGGDSALHFAANSGKTENVKVLLASGANVRIRGRGDDTPLHSATWHSDATAALIKLFIEAGADVNATNANGETPLHRMSPIESRPVTELLKAGANPNAKSNGGETLPKSRRSRRADIACCPGCQSGRQRRG
jgi:ankyrin repeat protein